jgi:hypothetical protein
MDNDKLESIAIIGINLKFSEDVISAETFWNMLWEAVHSEQSSGRSLYVDGTLDLFSVVCISSLFNKGACGAVLGW